MKRSPSNLAFGRCSLPIGCASAKVTRQNDLGAIPAGRPATVYMANSLVKDVKVAGLQAQRISAGGIWPHKRWLLRGLFAEGDQENRLRRAIVGFGAGKTDLEVEAALDDLSAGAPQPFHQVDAGAQSGKMPGAIIAMNPAVAAARFVAAGGDLDRNTGDTASQIAKSVAGRVAM